MVSDDQQVFENPVEKFEFWTQSSNEKMYFATIASLTAFRGPCKVFIFLEACYRILEVNS